MRREFWFTLRDGRGLCRRTCGSGWCERLRGECRATRPRTVRDLGRKRSALDQEWRERGATKAKRVGGDLGAFLGSEN